MKSLKKQITRYDSVFRGSGAILYKFGFSSSLQEALPNTLLLDNGPLPLKNCDTDDS